MTDKITRIAGLRKRASDPKTRDLLCHGGCISEIGDMIDEFEASAREEDNLYKAALSNWGEETQVKMAIEECAELIKVLVKYGRKINGSSDSEVQSEIADVQIMLNQLKIIFDEDAIAEVKAAKLERLRRILDGEGERRG